MAATATPKKLHNGDWGALAQTATVKSGDTLRITTKSGKQWNATVRQVLWTGDGKAICATNSGNSDGRHDGFCDECSEESRNLRPATDSSGIGGYVCGRCYGPPYMLSFA
jgi:predicted SprT family Zn-dependent metalloprotease